MCWWSCWPEAKPAWERVAPIACPPHLFSLFPLLTSSPYRALEHMMQLLTVSPCFWVCKIPLFHPRIGVCTRWFSVRDEFKMIYRRKPGRQALETQLVYWCLSLHKRLGAHQSFGQGLRHTPCQTSPSCCFARSQGPLLMLDRYLGALGNRTGCTGNLLAFISSVIPQLSPRGVTWGSPYLAPGKRYLLLVWSTGWGLDEVLFWSSGSVWSATPWGQQETHGLALQFLQDGLSLCSRATEGEGPEPQTYG